MGLNLTRLIDETLQTGQPDLNLSHKNIAEIPPEIRQLRDVVVRLGLSQNLLTRLPADMTALYRLKYLNVRGNQFAQFPLVVRASCCDRDVGGRGYLTGAQSARMYRSCATCPRWRSWTSAGTSCSSCRGISGS